MIAIALLMRGTIKSIFLGLEKSAVILSSGKQHCYDELMHTLRIAVWSGPRNISTAMMRSWENRPDTIVCDEPLYAHYLKVTGLDHPARDEVIAHHECDWKVVTNELIGSCSQPVFYQKHMSHHLLPNISRDWLSHLTNVFLIRHPREMITSLIKQIPEPCIEETGLPQQLELFEHLQLAGQTPLILDSKDILLDPHGMLSALCRELGIPFYEEMLSWPAGKRDSDGSWAPHWYSSVESSTGFLPWKPKEEQVSDELESLCLECEEMYLQLAASKMKPEGREHAPNI